MPISGNCVKCGTYRVSLHRDHIVPKSLGGSDEPDNIQLLCANCHQDKTTIDVGIIQNTPAFSAARSARKKAEWAKPEFRQKMLTAFDLQKRSERGKSFWNDLEYRAKQKATRGTPEYAAKRSAIVTALWQNPEYRAKRAAGITARHVKFDAWVIAYRAGERNYSAWEESYDEKVNVT